MTPTRIARRVVTDRLGLIDELLRDIRSLPLNDRHLFLCDRRNVWTAESCLRRILEALLDLGRHILARGYGSGVSEYKEIAAKLHEHGVLSAQESGVVRLLAGYRNRMVHFYHEVSVDELYEICAQQLDDVELVQQGFRRSLREHPEKPDQAL